METLFFMVEVFYTQIDAHKRPKTNIRPKMETLLIKGIFELLRRFLKTHQGLSISLERCKFDLARIPKN
jgi:hypothetical protein